MNEELVETLEYLNKMIDQVKDEDEILQQEESRIEKRRKELKTEIERLGRILQETGLNKVSTGKYTLVQEENEMATLIDDPIARDECIHWFREKGLAAKYVKVDGRSINKVYREWKERGELIPGISTYNKWTSKIIKG